MIKRAPARWPLALLLSFLTEAVNRTNTQEPEKTGILRPTDQSVLETGEVQVIARAGEVWLAGKSLKERQTQGTRQALSIRIRAGRHELIWRNGDALQKMQFVVTSSGNTPIPPDRKVYRAHPPQAECQNCHAGEDLGDFKKATVAETCFTYHEQKAYAAGHAQNDEALAECVFYATILTDRLRGSI